MKTINGIEVLNEPKINRCQCLVNIHSFILVHRVNIGI
jgi:hypothetical protein